MNYLIATSLILLSAVICSGHVHIMEPHGEVSAVKVNEPIVIKCESQADRNILWTFNHKPLTPNEHVNITEYHRADHTEHKEHDHDDHHDHKDDDEIDKLAHDNEGHDHGHDHDHDHDHDHSKAGDHNPSDEHAGHHRESVLFIAHAQASDAGTYGCNEAGDDHEEEHIDVTVDGKWGAERLLMQHDSTDKAHVGDMLHLVCHYYGTDTSATISWKKDGSAVQASENVVIKELSKPYGKKGALHKHKAALTDAGEYSCVVNTLSEKFKVTVKVTELVMNSGSVVQMTAIFVLLALLATKFL